MNIVRLLFLEVKRKSLRPYYITILVSTFCSLGFLYLMACIPKIDPYDSDIEMFNSYHFVIGLTMIVMMGIYIIISAISYFFLLSTINLFERFFGALVL